MGKSEGGFNSKVSPLTVFLNFWGWGRPTVPGNKRWPVKSEGEEGVFKNERAPGKGGAENRWGRGDSHGGRGGKPENRE